MLWAGLLVLGVAPNACTRLLGDFKIVTDAGVAGSSADGRVCALGSAQCSNGYLYTCNSQGTGWLQARVCASADLCNANDGGSCAQCAEGSYGCDGPNLNQCVNGAWQLRQACPEADLCNVGLISCGGCTNKDPPQCSGPNQDLLQRCQGNRWTTVDTCASAALCSASVEAAGTDNDAGASALHCIAPGCAPAGAYECDSPDTGEAGDAGAPDAEAADASATETGHNVLLRCPPNQTAWTAVDTCESAALCAQAAADPAGTAVRGDKCAAPACSPAGSYLCNGQDLQQCSDDLTQLKTIRTCVAPLQCNSTLATCEACNPGDYGCNGADLQQCGSDGAWKLISKCESSALCNPANALCTVAACSANAFKCDASAVPASANPPSAAPVELEQCNDSLTGWNAVKTCLSAALCDASSARCLDPVCPTAGALQCSGSTLQRCKDDLSGWSNVTTCGAGQACNPDPNNACIQQCAAPVSCNGKARQSCTNSLNGPVITTVATCATPELCACALASPENCLKGVTADKLCGNVVCGGSIAQHQCVGAALQQCAASRNAWLPDLTCDSAARCYAGTAPTYSDGYCAVCDTANAVTCNSNASPATLTTCSADRKSTNTTKCASGRTCFTPSSGAPYCASCNENDKQCGTGGVQTCQKGKWVTTATCSAGVQCIAGSGSTTAACGACVEGAKSCITGNIDVCSNGAWKLSASCTSGCADGSSSCYACGANAKTCLADGVTLQTCASHVLTSSSCANGCTPGASSCGIACTAPSCSSSGLQYCDPTTSTFISCPKGMSCSVDPDAGVASCM